MNYKSDMTALQMIDQAHVVRVMIELAAGGQPQIYITKTEAKRLVREYGLPDEDIATVHLNKENVCSLIFST